MTSPKSVKARKTETATRSWTAKPILSSDFTEAPPLQEVYVGVLKQRKDTSTAIKSISTILPGFAHLKRCSNGKLLLAPLHSDKSSCEKYHDISVGENELKTQLKERGFDLSLLKEKFQITKVPAKAPRTKMQANEASKIWPVNFHPDQTVESLIDGSIFDDDCLCAIERIMSLVIEAARLEAVGDKRCTGAVAIVDPVDGRILAVAAAKIDRHPMWHAAMLAVDLIARLHGGGAWKLNDEECEETKRRTDVVEEDKFDDERSGSNVTTENEKRLRRIKRRYEEETPLCYPKSISSLKFPAQTSLETPVVRKGRRNNDGKISKQKECKDNAKKCGPYLCTDYWAFLLMEPCPLCAMALLHSRVARIFYGTANQSVGVLGSKTILHTVPGLNHRYRVWSGILERECRQTVEEIDARRSCS
ncbi:PREDICTED: probable inactive tRNA-specific adenosine deaminase-like protein 3 [Cyphomyrmex costatus]|uniref:tRNA-specific adenosine deaminase-like protein 3 n=1 Tax=Cyphomyrmex costatus TaxID=456900 RepID=A0A195CUH3_9HYME|nr:PREDICTED: probable inactive tRNA-specific adenosine deaminase-like protein 3 [Cyphomyrmex costatus]KYN04172.1 tRNA-specific adenosine deaminase-like protein 3 [Cyphomyrmex costatus]